MAAAIIAIGNPGAGKSTILNSLAGEILFKSGVNIGKGMTYQMDEKVNERGRFFDTPGLADTMIREEAAKAISTALKKGGPFKILFFARQHAGRLIREDMTTFKLVLSSAPEIGSKYGFVINKVGKKVAKCLEDPKAAEDLIVTLFASVPEEKNRCAATSIICLPQLNEADDEENHLINLDSLTTLGGSSFREFVYGEVKTVQLTVNKAKDIKIENFEDTETALEVLERKMIEDREMFKEEKRLMYERMKRDEADRKEQREQEMEIFKKNMEVLTAELEQNREETEAARNDADRSKQLNMERMKIQLEQEAQKYQKAQADLARYQDRDWKKKQMPLLWRFM